MEEIKEKKTIKKRKTKYNKSKKLEKLKKLLLKKKQSKLRLSRFFLIINSTFLVLFIISCHSNYLFNSVCKWIFFILFIISFIAFLYFIVGYVKLDTNLKLPLKRWILNTITILYVLGCIIFINLLYGPLPKFREWLITTAMETMNHQYLCKIFYSDAYINNLLSQNYLIEPNEEMNTNLIKYNLDNSFEYDENNEYEVLMFKNHTKDEIYRILRFKVNGQNAYLAVVYDPAYCEFLTSGKFPYSGEYIVDMAKRTNALVAVNGGRFIDPTNKSNGNNPAGVTIQKRKIITDHDYEGTGWGTIGFNKDNILVLYKNKSAQELLELGVRDCVTSVPFLIVNGVPSFTKGNGGYGYAARTAVGQRIDGVTLLLVVDSNETRTSGASMKDLTDIMTHYGAINAAALDGGTSTVMVEKGVTISRPINGSLKNVTRPVATGLVVNDHKVE
ncbi:MAG: phosphodiester glycosidase family protein [Bacilli bacterium]|nr:phosphodiester glycosidase family protein [Bacilli bacterium]